MAKRPDDVAVNAAAGEAAWDEVARVPDTAETALARVEKRIGELADLIGASSQILDGLAARLAVLEGRPALAVIEEETSGPIDQLAAALAAAQGEITNPTKDKTANVKSQREGGANYSYDYADLANVLDAIRPVFSKNGLAIIQFPAVIDRGVVRVKTVIAHKSGQWVAGTLAASVAEARPQAIGSVITYLRRYGLQSLAGVAAEADDDASVGQGVEAEISRRSGVPRPQRRIEPPADPRRRPEPPLERQPEPSPEPSIAPPEDATVGARGGKEPISPAQRTKLNATITDRAKALGVARIVLADRVKAYMRTIGVESGSSNDLPRGRFEEVLKFAEKVTADREPGEEG